MMPCPTFWPVKRERWDILLIGDQEVGKTSFATRFSDDSFGIVLEEYYKSEGVLFNVAHAKECSLNANDSCAVSLLDTWVAQIDYRDMIDEMPSCHGYILLYSTTSRSSFQDLSRVCRQIPLNSRQDPNIILILVGTKSDLKSSRQVSAEDGMLMADELGCVAFFETSAKSGENVDVAVLSMIQALRKAATAREMDMLAPFKMIWNLPSRFRRKGGPS